MESEKSNTTFALRYAVRVLERQCRLWRSVDAASRACALFAGSGAIAGLGAQHVGFALVCGVVFALMQSVDFALRPAERSAAALGQRKQYAALLVQSGAMKLQDLEAALEKIRADDEVIVSDVLRRLAYNDVVRERGLDESACYPLSRSEQALARIA